MKMPLVLPSLRHVTQIVTQGDAWSYTTAMRSLRRGRVHEAFLGSDSTLTSVDHSGVMHVTHLAQSQINDVAERFASSGVEFWVLKPDAMQMIGEALWSFVPLALFAYLAFGWMSKAVKTGAQWKDGHVPVTTSNITFEDVAGCEVAKDELLEVVEFLKHPDRFERVGARAPRGILLEGPPGTGKTLLARAVAGEAEIDFFSVSASSFVEMYVGVGAARVRSLFREARKRAPCVVWIDEIDAVGRSRGGGGRANGNEEREATLNELLASMDGFSDRNGIVVMAATNRADVLDEALVRSGRFDRRIQVGLPTAAEREAILQVHCRDKELEDDVDLKAVADQTTGFSGADLSNLINEAAIRAARRNSAQLRWSDVADSLERMTMGVPRPMHGSLDMQQRVAVHEAGHALVAHFQDDFTDEVVRVSIVPRASGAGGFTSFRPCEDHAVGGLYTRKYLEAKLAVMLGGRAAEEIVLGYDTVSTGASSDLSQAVGLARRMVTEWGFGTVLSRSDEDSSERAADSVDHDVENLVDEAYGAALAVLNSHLSDLRVLTERLLREKTVEGL